MKDQLMDLTERYYKLAEDYDSYAFDDYLYAVDGEDMAFQEMEDEIMNNDQVVHDFLDEVISEDERHDIVSRAVAIKTELMEIHSAPEDRNGVKLAVNVAYSIADSAIDYNNIHNTGIEEVDVWRTVPAMAAELAKDDRLLLIASKTLSETVTADVMYNMDNLTDICGHLFLRFNECGSFNYRIKPFSKREILHHIANNSEYKAWQWMLKDYRKSTFETALHIYLNESHKAAKRYLMDSNKYPERMYQ